MWSDQELSGARAYYVIFSWDMYKDDPLVFFNLREGGLAIYGGVIAAVIAVFVFAKVKNYHHFRFWIQLHLHFEGQCLDAGEISLTGKHLVNIQMVICYETSGRCSQTSDITELMREHMQRQ